MLTDKKPLSGAALGGSGPRVGLSSHMAQESGAAAVTENTPAAGHMAAQSTAGDPEQALMRFRERGRRRQVEGNQTAEAAAQPKPAEHFRLPPSNFSASSELKAGYMASWAMSSAASGAINILKKVGPEATQLSDALKESGKVFSALGMVNTGIDTALVAVGAYDKIKDKMGTRATLLETAETHGAAGEEGSRSLHDLRMALIKDRIAEANLRQAAPGMVRDILGGGASLATTPLGMAKISVPSPYDAAMAFISPISYATQSAIRHRLVDRAEAREQRAIESLSTRQSAEQPLTPQTQSRLESLKRNGDISSNLLHLLVLRGEPAGKAFLLSLDTARSFDQSMANSSRTDRLAHSMRLLETFGGKSAASSLKNAFQFSWGEIAQKMLNVSGRDTALNSHASREAIRSAVLDTMVEQPLVNHDLNSVLSFMDQLYASRDRAIGRTVHENPQHLDELMGSLGLPQGLFGPNTKDALIRSEKANAFLARYIQAAPQEQRMVRDELMHFDRAKMLSPGATVHNTQRVRDAIRQEVASAYADGHDINWIAQIRQRKATGALPVITSDIPRAPLSEKTNLPMRQTLMAAASEHMETLRSGKRLARFEGTHATLIGIGAMTGAIGGPAGLVAAGTAIRTMSTMVNLGQIAFRNVVEKLDAQHKAPLTADMTTERAMLLKPYLAELTHRGLGAADLADPGQFMRTVLKMPETRTRLVEKLLDGSKQDKAMAMKYLEKSDPLASLKISAHFIGESLAGQQGEKNRASALQILAQDPALAKDRAAIQAMVPAEQGDKVNADTVSALTSKLDDAYFKSVQNPLEAADHIMSARNNFTFLNAINGLDVNKLTDADSLVTQACSTNTKYSMQVFAEQLSQTGTPQGRSAQELLRKMNFTEVQIAEISQMPLEKSMAALESTLLNPAIRTRLFSLPSLTPTRLTAASAVARDIEFKVTQDDPPNNWKMHYERQYLEVTGNKSPAGVGSLAHAVLMAANPGHSGGSKLGQQTTALLANAMAPVGLDDRLRMNEDPKLALQVLANYIGAKGKVQPFDVTLITPSATGLDRTSVRIGGSEPRKPSHEATIFVDNTQKSHLIWQNPALQPVRPSQRRQASGGPA